MLWIKMKAYLRLPEVRKALSNGIYSEILQIDTAEIIKPKSVSSVTKFYYIDF